jgi:hypothetical protein
MLAMVTQRRRWEEEGCRVSIAKERLLTQVKLEMVLCFWKGKKVIKKRKRGEELVKAKTKISYSGKGRSLKI